MLIEDRTGFSDTGRERDIFDGIPRDTSWLFQLADSLRGVISPAGLQDAVPTLSNALARIEGDTTLDNYRAGLLQEALAVSAGLVIDGRADSETLVAGEQTEITVQFYNAGPYEVTLNDISLITPPGWTVTGQDRGVMTVPTGDQIEAQLVLTIDPDAQPSQPYFLERPMWGAQYDWSDAQPEVRGRPFEPPVVRAVIHASVMGESLRLEREVTYRYSDQATGEVRRALRVVPAIDVKLNPGLVVWPAEGASEKTFTVSLAHNGTEPVGGTVRLDAPGWRMPQAERFQFGHSGESRTIQFRVTRPPGVDEAEASIRAIVETDDGRAFDRGITLIEYPHIRSVSRVAESVADVRIIPVRAPNLQAIGYVRGAADRVPDALVQFGLPVEILDAEALARADLSAFDAIVVGSRAYEIDSALVRQNGRLLEYVREGGLLLVQYQQYQFARGEYAPYPLSISRPHDRVTDETAPVTVLQPEHPVFNTPNEIGEADWEGWPQERGLYFAGTWDDAYAPLLEMQDPDREPVRGALLVANYGEGMYVYTGISFFRSLPVGNPGAYKLFLNLLGTNQSSVP